MKTIHNKIGQNKFHCNSDNRTAKISALLSGYVSNNNFFTDEYVLPEKLLLEKTATIKRFEHSPLGSELKKQTDISR